MEVDSLRSAALSRVPTYSRFWAQAVQMAWLPWRSAAQALLPPGLTLKQVEATTSADGTGETK
jgi:hypothetical protein